MKIYYPKPAMTTTQNHTLRNNNMAFEDLFDLNPHKPKPSQHVNPTKFLDVDDFEANNYITPDGFWLRTNGKTHTYPNGKVQACTLEWNINNANRQGSTFKLTKATIPTWAKQANCSEKYLAAAIACSTKYKDTLVGEFVKQQYGL